MNDENTERLVEKAYRRGVHQAFVMLGYYCKTEGISADVALPEATELASQFRAAQRAYPSLLHRLFSQLRSERKGKGESMNKRMTDEELETMGRNLAAMHQLAIETWRLAMRTMPINSAQYRKICAAGRKTQDAYAELRVEAMDRGWDDERLQRVFSSRTSCGFS